MASHQTAPHHERVTLGDVDLILSSFAVRYKDKRLVNGIEQKVLSLITCDCSQPDDDQASSSGFVVLSNDAGELCTTYPSKIVIPQHTSHGGRGSSDNPPPLEATRLKELTRRASRARCRGRFPAPVIAIDGKYICRSATLSTGVEIYGRSFLGSSNLKTTAVDNTPSVTFDNTSSTYDGPSPGDSTNGAGQEPTATHMTTNPALAEYGVAGTSADLCSRARAADIALLKYLNVGHIGDLMVEKKKVKYGVYVTSSEKVDKEGRYAEFAIFSLPYPGCEFFAKLRDSDYQAEHLYYDWNNQINDAELSMPEGEELARQSAKILQLDSDWSCYKRWDIITLTRNYLRLLLLYCSKSDDGFLVHCISGWDRTPLFISLLRLSLWADGLIHKGLSALEVVYLTLAYDWFLFGHDLTDRLRRGEEILFFCFYFLKYIGSEEFIYPELQFISRSKSNSNNSHSQGPLVDLSPESSIENGAGRQSSAVHAGHHHHRSGAGNSHQASNTSPYSSGSGRVRKPSFKIGDFHLEDSVDEFMDGAGTTSSTAATIAAASGLLGSCSSLSSLSSISSLRSNGTGGTGGAGAEATPPRYFPTCGAQERFLSAFTASATSASNAGRSQAPETIDEVDHGSQSTSNLIDLISSNVVIHQNNNNCKNSGYESATTLTGSPPLGNGNGRPTNPMSIPPSQPNSKEQSPISPDRGVPGGGIPTLCRSDSWQIVTETGSFLDPRLGEVRGSINSNSSTESPRPSRHYSRTSSIGSDFRLSPAGSDPKSRSSLSGHIENLSLGTEAQGRVKNYSGSGASFTSIPEAVTPPPPRTAAEVRRERLDEARKIFYKSYASVVGFHAKSGLYPGQNGAPALSRGGGPTRGGLDSMSSTTTAAANQRYHHSGGLRTDSDAGSGSHGNGNGNGNSSFASAAAVGMGWFATQLNSTLASATSGLANSSTASASASNRTAAATE